MCLNLTRVYLPLFFSFFFLFFFSSLSDNHHYWLSSPFHTLLSVYFSEVMWDREGWGTTISVGLGWDRSFSGVALGLGELCEAGVVGAGIVIPCDPLPSLDMGKSSQQCSRHKNGIWVKIFRVGQLVSFCRPLFNDCRLSLAISLGHKI